MLVGNFVKNIMTVFYSPNDKPSLIIRRCFVRSKFEAIEFILTEIDVSLKDKEV